MAYSVFTPTGSEYAVTPLTVPDNAIDQALYNSANKLGVQFVGRNAIDYGTAIAQNTVQLASNFAGINAPTPSQSLQGQLWFRITSTTSGLLYVRNSTSAGGAFPSGWDRLPVVNPATPAPGDIQVTTGPSGASIYIDGSWEAIPVGETASQIPTINPGGTPKEGDIQILTGPTRINIYAAGGWRQVFPAQYS